MSRNFDEKNLYFTNNDDNESLYKLSIEKIGQENENVISINTISYELEQIEYFNYKNDLLEAIQILMENDEDDKKEIVIFNNDIYNSDYPVKLDLSLSYDNVNDIGKLYRLGKMHSLNLSQDSVIKNLYLYSIYLTNKFIEKHKKQVNIYPNLTIFSTNEEKKQNVNNINISHLNKELQKKISKKNTNTSQMKKHQFLHNVIKTNLLDIKNFMQNNKEIEDLYNEINGYINYDMIFSCYESKKNQKIFSNNIYREVLELINKIVLYYNENCNCFIEKNTDEINNLAKKSKDEFISTFNKIKKPILAVKENEKISILCLNHHRDSYFNKTNMKLTGFSQNSPSLYEFLADFFSISAVISTCFKLQEQYYKNIKVKHQSNKAESESKIAELKLESKIAKFKQKIEEKSKSKSKKKKKLEDMSFISDLKDKNEDNFINNQKTTLINFDFIKIDKI